MITKKLDSWTIKDIIKKIEEKDIYLKPDLYKNENISQLEDYKDDYEFDDDDKELNKDTDALNIQRAVIWNNSKRKKLIETIEKNLIIPPIILFKLEEIKRFNFSIIDGKQRIDAIWSFYKDFGNFKVKFNEMNETEKENFLKYEIDVLIISNCTFEDLIYIFESINVNSTKLKPQEVRHAIYRNDLTKFLNYFHKTENQNKNRKPMELNIFDYAKETGIFNSGKIINRSFDEFLLKILRLHIDKKILNDSKSDIDKYYQVNSNFDFNDFEKNEYGKFYKQFKMILQLLRMTQSLIPKNIRKPILIYILYNIYFIKKSCFLNINDKKKVEEKWKRVFNDFSDHQDTYILMRNQNQKSNREKLSEILISIVNKY